MKKILIISLLAFSLGLSACSAPKVSSAIEQEGLAPYELSEDAEFVLDCFGMSGTSQIISFNAPE